MGKLYRIVELPSDEEVDYIGYPATPMGITDKELVGFVEIDTSILPNLDELDEPKTKTFPNQYARRIKL